MYTIRLKGLDYALSGHVMSAMGQRINRDESRFMAHFELVVAKLSGLEWDIHVSHVRLREAKPYCGQHPGECLAGGPKRRGRWLEWDDWVEFHGLVNDVLDKLNVSADVWTEPREVMDKGRKMWIRKGKVRRVKYEWGEKPAGFGGWIRVWNHGTEDQFHGA